MDNQHRQIKGYRELNEYEIAVMNRVKELGEQVGEHVARMTGSAEFDQRWVAIAATDLQKGFMALIRAIAKPTSF